VAKKFGVFDDALGLPERASLLIDEHQQIRAFKKYDNGTVPDVGRFIDYLKRLP
jgi:alkyl hydroperoxide reductase subunit AhpC